MNNSVVLLDSLLAQFYDVTNYDKDKKAAIEKQLAELKERDDSWQLAAACFELSNNPTVLWFAVSVYDHLLRSRWFVLPVELKANIRKLLFQYVTQNHAKLQGFVVKPMCNTIVRIAKVDWPNEYPNFITDTIEAVKHPSSCQAGLMIIRQIADEFNPNSIKAPAQKKAALAQNIKLQLPLILNTLRSLLEAQLTTIQNGTFSDATSKNYATLALEALLQFLGWIPMNDVLNPQFLDLLFRYIHNHRDDTSIIAFSCVNEILGQNYFPKEFSDFMITIFKELFTLLQALTKAEDGLRNVDDAFADKFTQFTSLFVSMHLRRVEKNETFPIIEFLSLLFQYTFMQTSLEGFLACLEIWETFLDYIIAEIEADNESSLYTRYADGLAALAKTLAQKILFQINGSLLSELSTDSSSEDNNDSELETYIHNSLNIIGKVAQLYSSRILGELWNLFQERTSQFTQVHQVVGQTDLPSDLRKKVSYVMKDMLTSLAMFDHVAIGFANVELPGGCALLNEFVALGKYIFTHQLFSKHKVGTRLTCQLFATLRAYVGWERAHYRATAPSELDVLLSSQVSLILQSLMVNTTFPVIAKAGLALLDSLGQAMPLYALPEIQQTLFGNIPAIVSNSDTSVQAQLFQAIVSIVLVTPLTPDVRVVDWNERLLCMKKVFEEPVVVPFVSKMEPLLIDAESTHSLAAFAQPVVIEFVKRSVIVIYSMFDRVEDMEKKAKTVIYQCSHASFLLVLRLFRYYLDHSDVVKEILKFFLKLFTGLHGLVDVSFAHQIISTFMDVLQGDRIKQIFASENPHQIEVVKHFLALLTIIMRNPSSAYQSYIIPIFNLSTSIYSILCETKAEFNDVKIDLFQLLFTTLDNHWNYCIDQINPNVGVNVVLSLMKHSFAQVDLNVFKTNINLLSQLYKHHRLFQRDFFLKEWRGGFLEVLITVFLQASHNITR